MFDFPRRDTAERATDTEKVEVINRHNVLSPLDRTDNDNPYSYFPTPQSKFQARMNINHFKWKATNAEKKLADNIAGEMNAKDNRTKLALRRGAVRLNDERKTAETWARHWETQLAKLP